MNGDQAGLASAKGNAGISNARQHRPETPVLEHDNLGARRQSHGGQPGRQVVAPVHARDNTAEACGQIAQGGDFGTGQGVNLWLIWQLL